MMEALRFAIAYVVAVLAIPVVDWRLWDPNLPHYAFFIVLVYCPITTVGALAFALPIYGLVQQWGWTAFWVAPIAGFVAATLIWLFVQVAMLGLFGEVYLHDRGYIDWLRGILWPYGPLGAAMASLLWIWAWLERRCSPR
jgi:hypothetical protein